MHFLPQEVSAMLERRSIRIFSGEGGKRPIDGVHLRSMPAIESHWMTTFDLRWLQHLREERRPSNAGRTRVASAG
jgi:hypothetical protein